MSWRSKGGRVTLRQGLDKEVYQVVRKITEEQIQYGSSDAPLSAVTVYDSIKRSNSSLNRKSKRLLEDSIERVMEMVRETELERESGSASDVEEASRVAVVDDNTMNDSIVGLWSVPRSARSNGAGAVLTSAGHCRTSALTRRSQSKESAVPERIRPSYSKQQARELESEPPAKKRKGEKSSKNVDRSPPTHVSLADLGGVDAVKKKLMMLVALPIKCPALFAQMRAEPTRGVLLHGPPGCGKTTLANAFAAKLGVPYISISTPSVVSGMSGESEKKLRDHFDEARRMAPCLMFIDEIDAITPKRESAQREMEKRIVTQMLMCMDDLALENTGGKAVIVMAATNNPDSLDPGLRRPGRFDQEISLGVPDEPGRECILRALTRDLPLTDAIDLRMLAKMTPGYVGADLKGLVSTARTAAIERVFDALTQGPMELDGSGELSLDDRMLHEFDKISANGPSSEDLASMTIGQNDLLAALAKVQPSLKREGFATVPDTTWKDIGALQSVRKKLEMAIVERIRSPERFAKMGITAPKGVLLWGPPGCGKTLLAKAVANASQANFISVMGPEMLNKYVGESERAIRQAFARARAAVPCVIFFDEFEAIAPRRGSCSSEAAARVVTTMLTELDGLSNREGIYVVAATNRPQTIDRAMLRPGRLDKTLFIDLPDAEGRVEIIRTLNRARTTADLDDVARRCHGFSGADLKNLLGAAGEVAMERNADVVENQDFESAMQEVHRSVSEEEQARYHRTLSTWR